MNDSTGVAGLTAMGGDWPGRGAEPELVRYREVHNDAGDWNEACHCYSHELNRYRGTVRPRATDYTEDGTLRRNTVPAPVQPTPVYWGRSRPRVPDYVTENGPLRGYTDANPNNRNTDPAPVQPTPVQTVYRGPGRPRATVYAEDLRRNTGCNANNRNTVPAPVQPTPVQTVYRAPSRPRVPDYVTENGPLRGYTDANPNNRNTDPAPVQPTPVQTVYRGPGRPRNTDYFGVLNRGVGGMGGMGGMGGGMGTVYQGIRGPRVRDYDYASDGGIRQW